MRLKRFVVAEDSMVPNLYPGDGLIGWRGGRVKPGQIRMFEHPERPGFWLVKRVGEVNGNRFRALSDNKDAVGVVDSRVFGDVPTEGSYRMLARLRRATMVASPPDS